MLSSHRRYRDTEDLESILAARDQDALRLAFLRSPLALRLLLIAVCALAAATAILLTDGGIQSTDPDLAKLLRGMAIIKSVILLFAGAAMWWRLGSPMQPGFAAGYMVAAAAAAGGAALVWNMSGLWLAPFLFDGGLLAFLILALRDDNGPWLRSLTRARTRRGE